MDEGIGENRYQDQREREDDHAGGELPERRPGDGGEHGLGEHRNHALCEADGWGRRLVSDAVDPAAIL